MYSFACKFTSSVNSIGYYLWDFGDGNSSTLANPSHTYSTDGYYSVNVRFEDLTGCVDSFDFDVNPYPVPQVNFLAHQLDTCVLPVITTFKIQHLAALLTIGILETVILQFSFSCTFLQCIWKFHNKSSYFEYLWMY